jgi:hypothetical protein
MALVVVDAHSVRAIWCMVSRYGVYQVRCWLHVGSSCDSRQHIVLMRRLRNVPTHGSVPTPYRLWPEKYQNVAPLLYYLLVGGFALIL